MNSSIDLPVWMDGSFGDTVNIWRVDHPSDGSDDVITLNAANVRAQLLFADNVASPTDIGRVRTFSLRRATVCNLHINTELGPDWFIQDATPGRPESERFVYRVQEQPYSYPSYSVFELDYKSAIIEHDPQPPEEIV